MGSMPELRHAGTSMEHSTMMVRRAVVPIKATGSKGLTSPEYLQLAQKPKGFFAALKLLFASPPAECAVCIPDGARLFLHAIPAGLQKACGIGDAEPVTFRQLSADAATYRDAVKFQNRIRLRLQDLEEGQTVTVLALSPAETPVEAETGFLPTSLRSR